MYSPTWMWCIFALTKLQVCLTSSKAPLRCARCSDCWRSKTHATSILGLPEIVVRPDTSLWVPTLSVLDTPSTPGCTARAVQKRQHYSIIHLNKFLIGSALNALSFFIQIQCFCKIFLCLTGYILRVTTSWRHLSVYIRKSFSYKHNVQC